jgi:hypothetical protein
MNYNIRKCILIGVASEDLRIIEGQSAHEYGTGRVVQYHSRSSS